MVWKRQGVQVAEDGGADDEEGEKESDGDGSTGEGRSGGGGSAMTERGTGKKVAEAGIS